jgi:proteasome lid subunit RPN8/RPN11
MDYDCYILENAYSKACAHAAKAAGAKLESMGLLTGKVCSSNGKTFVVVTDYITAGNSSTAVSVKFEPEAFGQLAQSFAQRLQKGELIVGWLHSHPSYGCFLSSTDVRTQQTFFAEPFNIAVVVDPVQAEQEKTHAVRAYRLDLGQPIGYKEISFAVIRKRF